MVDVRPVTKIPGRGFGFHKDKLALIALRVIQRVAHGIVSSIGGAVDDCISSIALALYTVSVVAACCKKLITYTVPLINFILGDGGNRVAGFAVGFSDIDLQAPFRVAHQVLVAGVGRHGQGLIAAVAAPVFFKAVGHGDFFVSEL